MEDRIKGELASEELKKRILKADPVEACTLLHSGMKGLSSEEAAASWTKGFNPEIYLVNTQVAILPVLILLGVKGGTLFSGSVLGKILL